MTLRAREAAFRDRWRRRRRDWRRALDRRIALDRWFPHTVIAALVAPLGLLIVAASVQKALGVGLLSVDASALEQRIIETEHRPIVDTALGVSLVAISLGLALRSRIAWIWSVAVMVVAIGLRVPPAPEQVPILIYLATLLVLLVFCRHGFATQSVVTSTMFAVVVLASFSTWAVLGTMRLGHEFEPPVRDLETAIYLTVVTVSSVGFGDIVARTPRARLFVSSEIAIGIIVVASSFSAILLPLVGGRLRKILGGSRRVERTDHYVVVGHSPLARNAATELEKRGQRVTLILGSPSEDVFYKQRDVVVGDATDLSVLRTAGVADAKAVLALSTDDATNGFVVLGVNELDATVTTVTALNDSANRFRLQRTQPSMLLSLQSLGGELLAMALTGERVGVDMLTRVLQVHGTDDETGS